MYRVCDFRLYMYFFIFHNIRDVLSLVCEGDEPEEPGGLGGPPLPGGAVGQGHHHRLQVRAHDLELAHGFELHRLTRQVLLEGIFI